MHETFEKFPEKIEAPVEHILFNDFLFPVSILRLDKIDSWASGNKYFKLKYSLQSAIAQGARTIVSKGGMFSNHLESLSGACDVFNLRCVCIIRSYKPDEESPTIKVLRGRGVELHFLAPDQYAGFDENKSDELYPGSYFIPEGGADDRGIKGASEIMDVIGRNHYSHIILAGGTMGTAAGIISATGFPTKVIIVPAWKGCTRNYLEAFLDVHQIHAKHQWDVWPEYHFGGFGKYNSELVNFMVRFTEATSIPLDPVYTGKMMFALYYKLSQGIFSTEDQILCIHTGGLQGIAGFVYRHPETVALWEVFQKNNGRFRL